MPTRPAGSDSGNDGTKTADRRFILISGRHEDTRQMMRLMLEVWGFEVAEARSPDESLALARQHKPCLVMLDAAIPFDESLRTAELLKGYSITQDVPILMISGFGQAPYREAALQGGVSDYLVKPVDFDDLRQFVTRLANLKMRHDEEDEEIISS